jgi:hypothetical protein
MQRDAVWYEDIRVIPRQWHAFWPRASMTVEERTNALVRLFLYVTVAVYAYNRDVRGAGLGLAAIAVVSFLHRRSPDVPVSAYGTTTTMAVSSTGATLGTLSSVGGPDAPTLGPAGRTACRRSTPSNPFANHLLGDPGDAPAACPYDDHKDAIRENFNRDLYRDSTDLWEKHNSQRQFFSMPYAKMPDTKAFGEFLAAPHRTCKEDPTVCTGFR